MRSISIRALTIATVLAGGTLNAPLSWAQSAVPVSTAVVVRKDVPIYAAGIGTVAADQLAQVRAQVDGIINKINFTEGQAVKQGDVLAQIDPRPYQAAVDQALAKKQSDQAALADALRDLKRDDYLVKTKDVPQQTLDQQNSTVAQDTASVAGDTATLATAKLNLEWTQITAPISGRVGLRQIDLGNLVHATDTTALVTIAAVHPISVLFTLPQDQITAIADLLARATPATVLAYNADGSTLLGTGQLVTADNQIDSTTGTIKLKATFANQDNHLWPGQFVNVKLLVATSQGALAVPSLAVQRSPSGPFVYVVGPGSKATARPVTLGADDGVTAVVTSGVNAGDIVVTNGTSRLSDGALVQVRNDLGGAS